MSEAPLPAPGDVHVWHVRIDLADASAAALERLSPGERRRALQMRLPAARARFVTARAELRSILSECTGLHPVEIQLRTTAGGKPELAPGGDLHFSISHAADTAVIVVARSAVGVDMERVRLPARMHRTAARIFHGETAAMLDALPDDRRLDAFFDAWTQREAHVKAVGGGLFRTADTLPFRPGLEPGAVHEIVERGTRLRWSVIRLPCAAGMRATVVAHGHVERISDRTRQVES